MVKAREAKVIADRLEMIAKGLAGVERAIIETAEPSVENMARSQLLRDMECAGCGGGPFPAHWPFRYCGVCLPEAKDTDTEGAEESAIDPGWQEAADKLDAQHAWFRLGVELEVKAGSPFEAVSAVEFGVSQVEDVRVTGWTVGDQPVSPEDVEDARVGSGSGWHFEQGRQMGRQESAGWFTPDDVLMLMELLGSAPNAPSTPAVRARGELVNKLEALYALIAPPDQTRAGEE